MEVAEQALTRQEFKELDIKIHTYTMARVRHAAAASLAATVQKTTDDTGEMVPSSLVVYHETLCWVIAGLEQTPVPHTWSVSRRQARLLPVSLKATCGLSQSSTQ